MKLVPVALVAFIAGAPLTSMAAPSWQDVTASTTARAIDTAPPARSGVIVRFMPRASRPNAATAFIINFVTAGVNASGVPCFNCVNGASGFTLGLPAPDNEVPANTFEQYNVSWTNLTFVGTCKVSIVIAAGKNVLDKASYKVSGIHNPGSLDIGFARPRPAYSGAATVTGKVACGTQSASVSAALLFD